MSVKSCKVQKAKKELGIWLARLMLVSTILPLEVSAEPSSASAESDAATLAEAALVRGDDESALRLFEKAYLDTGDGYYIYKRIGIYERQGDYSRALNLLEEQREELLESARVTDLATVEARLREQHRLSQDPSLSAGETAPDSRRKRAIIGLATGGALLIGGGLSLISAHRQESRLRCDDTRGCDGGGLTQAEWDAQWRGVRVREGLGWGLGLTGLAALGYGVFHMTRQRSESPPARAHQPHVQPSLTRDSATLHIYLSF